MGAGYSTEFTVHDLSDFPIVRFHHRAAAPGYAPAWCREMEALLDRGEPFVILFPDIGHEDEAEHHEDRKLRALWLKANKAALASLCRGVVSIEPDETLRSARQAQAAGFEKAFGLTMTVAPDLPAAEEWSRTLMTGNAGTGATG